MELQLRIVRDMQSSGWSDKRCQMNLRLTVEEKRRRNGGLGTSCPLYRHACNSLILTPPPLPQSPSRGHLHSLLLSPQVTHSALCVARPPTAIRGLGGGRGCDRTGEGGGGGTQFNSFIHLLELPLLLLLVRSSSAADYPCG